LAAVEIAGVAIQRQPIAFVIVLSSHLW
jgi:hypothetical protein